MKKLIQLMGIATVGLAAGVANAETASMQKVESKSTTVSFSRAEAQTLEGARDLYRRLRSAAEGVCSEVMPPDGPSRHDYRQCVSSALENAVHATNVPLVSLLHGDRSTALLLVAN